MKTHPSPILVGVFVLLATAALSGCNKDSNPTQPGGPAANVTVNIVGMNGSNSYSPNPAFVTVGQTVAWKNQDGTTHTATSLGAGTSFNTGNISAGATSAAINVFLAAPDTINYRCTLHPTMTGTIIVTP